MIKLIIISIMKIITLFKFKLINWKLIVLDYTNKAVDSSVYCSI